MLLYALKHDGKGVVLRKCSSFDRQILEDIDNGVDNHDDTFLCQKIHPFMSLLKSPEIVIRQWLSDRIRFYFTDYFTDCFDYGEILIIFERSQDNVDNVCDGGNPAIDGAFWITNLNIFWPFLHEIVRLIIDYWVREEWCHKRIVNIATPYIGVAETVDALLEGNYCRC